MTDDCDISTMDRYQIVPGRRVYRVEAVDDASGAIRIVGTWPTEDAAISHLKTLQESVERLVDRVKRCSNETGAADTKPPILRLSGGRPLMLPRKAVTHLVSNPDSVSVMPSSHAKTIIAALSTTLRMPPGRSATLSPLASSRGESVAGAAG